AYLLIMYDVNKASKVGAKKAEKIYQKSQASECFFCAVTASSDEDIQNFIHQTGVTYPFCKADPIMLKTIIRGNPGLVLIKDGTIIGKWNWRDF
ncbi:MAG TPA: DoxX family protein, partial [Paludibacteraceae bacterium]|nr:DoxX family protein [Paludibacteraceae bacterium]